MARINESRGLLKSRRALSVSKTITKDKARREREDSQAAPMGKKRGDWSPNWHKRTQKPYASFVSLIFLFSFFSNHPYKSVSHCVPCVSVCIYLFTSRVVLFTNNNNNKEKAKEKKKKKERGIDPTWPIDQSWVGDRHARNSLWLKPFLLLFSSSPLHWVFFPPFLSLSCPTDTFTFLLQSIIWKDEEEERKEWKRRKKKIVEWEKYESPSESLASEDSLATSCRPVMMLCSISGRLSSSCRRKALKSSCKRHKGSEWEWGQMCCGSISNGLDTHCLS